jgi:hypothetical protein
MVTSIQKWDTAFSGGILNFESWYPSWILRKYLNFRPWFTLYRIAFCTGVKKHLSDTEVEQNNISVVIIPLKIAFRRDTDSVFSCHYPVQCKHGLHIAEIKSRLHM